MKIHKNYSALFSTIHDEQEAVGEIGRGCHYSILRAAQWFDKMNKPTKEGVIQDIAVIWDEDHDQRIIMALEKMHMEGLLAPVLFVGERKGSLTVIVNSDFYKNSSSIILDIYKNKISNLAEYFHSDVWHSEVGYFDRDEAPRASILSWIINDSVAKVDSYVRNIESLWSLGVKDFNADLHSFETIIFNNRDGKYAE